MQRLFHRVDRVSRAGEQAVRGNVMKTLRQLLAGGFQWPENLSCWKPQFGDGHAIFGQGAGLVSTQHGRGAKGFDRRGTPGQHVRLRDAPSPHRHEDGQNDREFLGQHRHAERDAGENGVEPTAAQKAVEQHRQDTDRAARRGEQAYQPTGFGLQSGWFGLQRAERLADPADLAADAGRDDLRCSGPAHDERA